jgi:hypothetical protein
MTIAASKHGYVLLDYGGIPIMDPLYHCVIFCEKLEDAKTLAAEYESVLAHPVPLVRWDFHTSTTSRFHTS